MRLIEKAGFITSYHAKVNELKIGADVFAFVRLDSDRNTVDITRQLEDAIRQLADVTRFYYINGVGTVQHICLLLSEVKAGGVH